MTIPTDFSSEKTSVKNAGSALIRSMSRDMALTILRHLKEIVFKLNVTGGLYIEFL